MVHLVLQPERAKRELLAEKRESKRGQREGCATLVGRRIPGDPKYLLSLFSISLFLVVIMWEYVYANLFIIAPPFLLANSLDVGLLVVYRFFQVSSNFAFRIYYTFSTMYL